MVFNKNLIDELHKLHKLMRVQRCGKMDWLSFFDNYFPLIQSFNSYMFDSKARSSGSWRECCEHEEEIGILQEKVMQLHNKLLDQLDLCKEKELTIIQLTRKASHASSSAAFDTFKYQSFGQHSHDSKENHAPNYSPFPHHDSTNSQHAKTELLQADLEAMRAKVLAEITEKNRLKEEVKEIRSIHKKENAILQRKVEGLQSLVSKLREENEQLKERYERAKRDHRSDSQLERMAVRLGEMEARHMKEKDSNRELIEENMQLTEKLDELERELQLEREGRKDKRTFAESSGSQGSQGSKGEYLKTQAPKMGRQNDYREEDYARQREREREREKQKEKQRERQREKQRERQRQKERQRQRDRVEDKHSHKKRGFEQTKELIKKLQEAEINMRKNRKQPL